MVSRQYSKPYPPLLYTLMAHRAFPATFDAAAQSIVQGGSAPFLPGRRPPQRGLWNLLAEAGPPPPPYRPYQMWPQPLETLLRTLTQCYGIFSGQDTTAVYEDARKTFQAHVEHPLSPSARPSASGGLPFAGVAPRLRLRSGLLFLFGVQLSISAGSNDEPQ